eukprot:354226-Prymnesium_polylepis.1
MVGGRTEVEGTALYPQPTQLPHSHYFSSSSSNSSPPAFHPNEARRVPPGRSLPTAVAVAVVARLRIVVRLRPARGDLEWQRARCEAKQRARAAEARRQQRRLRLVARVGRVRRMLEEARRGLPAVVLVEGIRRQRLAVHVEVCRAQRPGQWPQPV